ncbi:hypothetical protein [Marinilabilia rubra]|uniref:STAS/SEC14 domain-containing protein n=1 Tax=Marinilabilia rubra TaxID=2162893 RepID=A0A2U2BCH2_9BACT|nr:hypothetical protein [Marinilabilia rubra]PWE00768.1 hypothetical protein DDZ16_04020 [Marinilabilia rubra]
MSSSLEYKSDLKILIKEQTGSVSIEDVLSFSNHLAQKDNVLKETAGLIFDCRNALLDYDLDEQNLLTNNLRTRANLYNNLKIAVVSNDPHNVVLIMMLGHADNNLFITPFSTIQGAIAWMSRHKSSVK